MVETEQGVRLRSIIYQHVWEPLEKCSAVCLRPGQSGQHFAPAKGCGCGIYAVKDLGHLRLYLAETINVKTGTRQPPCPRAFGLVDLWGRVIRASNGYRAMFAYPKALYLPCLSHPYSADLGVYGVPVECVDEENAFSALMKVARSVRDGSS